MAIPSIRWFRRIGIALVAAITILALLWVALFWWQRLSLPWDNRLAVAIVVPVVAFVWAIWWLWWRLPRRQLHKLDVQIHDPKARADTEDNFRKTVGQALGGVAVLIGAAVAYLQFTQQQQASHDLLISNQVSKGFEQLGSKEVATRLGGIYALEGVMKVSPEYHQPVLEALCAFVRDGTTQEHAMAIPGFNRPPNDIQAALTVISRRTPGPGDVNLREANIPGAALTGANLSGAALSGADLTGANLSGANLSGAALNGAKLNGANLSRANVSDTYLFYADLSGAILEDAKNLTQTQLDQACGKPSVLPPGITRYKDPCLLRPSQR
jgi:hypothetical protein